ncbi:MAG: MotA/TolQ/ExbB proton channel family protein [Psychromonas sp.]|nr:MotA/TolQ/ExbB proton channel family protein [Psychromonas sp.]
MLHTLLSESPFLANHWATLNHFLQQGGPILLWLAAVVFICCCLLIERLLFIFMVFPTIQQHWVKRWENRTEHHSWYAKAQRNATLSEAHLLLFQHLSLIKVLVAICPMLGLLGTVTGMVSVFDVMATLGSSKPQLMASGISMATLPTMAGMVAALFGLFMHARLQKICLTKQHQLEKKLRSL